MDQGSLSQVEVYTFLNASACRGENERRLVCHIDSQSAIFTLPYAVFVRIAKHIDVAHISGL